MYRALATATQFASFVLLCGILELIVGIWLCALATAKQFASFVLLCGILELIVGIWSCFDVFVPVYMIISHI